MKSFRSQTPKNQRENTNENEIGNHCLGTFLNKELEGFKSTSGKYSIRKNMKDN